MVKPPSEAKTPLPSHHPTHVVRISLRLMDEVATTRAELVIMKRGKPVARLVPVNESAVESFGALRGSVVLHGDIVAPDHDSWNEPDL